MSPELSKVQKNIYRQAALAGLTVVLTIVILFAMTSAWYTNIVQTSGLVFEAEPWGFDGEIIVNTEPIEAAPGDDGLIHLEVENKSESISAISVNVSKAGMVEEMQKRLFFYVDTHMTRDGETMDRVYLNDYEGYTYTVFNQGWLTLTEERNNAPQLKWEWVYDVLGYYVLAQRDTVTVNGTATDRMTIKEYLRPIEYDFDKATTTFETDQDGKLNIALTTVDGKMSLDTFLVQLSKTDGYEGTIDVSKKFGDGYYPVDVDDNGYGVYAYLCNYSQIELATQWDTALGEIAYRNAKKDATLTDAEKALLKHTATLTISAQKSESSVVNVSTLNALEKALTTSDADVIQLSSNITIPANDTLVIPENTRVMLDLNDHTLTSQNTTGTAIKAQSGSSLTLTNGIITGPKAGTGAVRGIETIGAEVVMSDIQMEGFDYGFYIGDNNDNNALDSRVHLMGCTLDAEWYAVFISGNGTNSEQKTQLIVEKSKLSSDGIVITGNGSTSGSGRWGTDIQIIDSTVTQTSTDQGAGIYQPQMNSTLTVYNSEVTGYTGIAIKGGSVNIIDSTITGNGTSHVEPSFDGSGFSDTADAVYIETNYGYEIRLDISGSVLTSLYAGDSLRVYEQNATNVLVQIVSGTFDEEQPNAYIAEGSAKSTKNDKCVVTVTAAAQ